jgi:senataxin
MYRPLCRTAFCFDIPQRKVFQQSAARAPFHTVLIDEAGQASEVAALQPLVFGAKR